MTALRSVHEIASYAASVDSAAPVTTAVPAVHAITDDRPVVDSSLPVRATRRRGLGNMARRSKPEAAAAIVDTLAQEGGKLSKASVRTLADRIAASRSTTHNAVVELIAAGVVAHIGEELVLRS
jgi:hypothetical protein